MSKTENGITKLSPKEISSLREQAKTNKELKKLLDVYDTFFADANKEWNLTIITIQRILSKAVMDKSIDLDDKYFKTLWEILKAGASASKTIAAAKTDAGIIDEILIDEKSKITPITAETA